MKVLLISPLPHVDPACGDVTYTQALLRDPPEGVRYETYGAAIERGALVERARWRRFGKEPLLYVANKAINWLRGRKLLFWEPFRFFEVRRGEYDLVHVHLFACHFEGYPPPLVFGGGAPQRDLYLDARGQSVPRVRLQETLEQGLCRALGVNSYSYWLPTARRLLTYSDYAREWFAARRVMPRERIDVTPIFLPEAPTRPPRARPYQVGFVAKDFEAKGGPTLLEAFRTVRGSRRDARLTIVGSPPRGDAAELSREGITWLPYIPRERLLSEVLPEWDVFAYPTRIDCISYVLLEAMSRGLAIATSDYPSMPEAVAHGAAGLISPVGDAGRLAENILRLLEPSENRQFRAAAHEHFRATYSAGVVRAKLRATYEKAVSECASR